MNHSEQVDKIMPALVNAQASVEEVAKSGRNEHHRYNYAGLEDYQNAIGQALTENGLAVTFTSRLLEDRDSITRLVVTTTAWHSSGQWVSVDTIGYGADKQDKGPYKATTGARKYGLACLFNMVTTDDPEKDENLPEKKASPQRRTPSHNGQTATPKQRFAEKVREWSGVTGDDLKDAMYQTLQFFGVDLDESGKVKNEAVLATVCQSIDAKIAEGEDFFEAMQRGAK